MSAVEIEETSTDCFIGRSRRRRSDTQRMFQASDPKEKNLELEGIVSVLQSYDEYGGGVNCSVCGKLYKSKVCFTKHLWEHSVYWDLFAGEKNHDRVLSIQAALIIYSNSHGDQDLLTSLLVTSPHQANEKKQSESPCAESVSQLPELEQQDGLTTPKKNKIKRLRQTTPGKKRGCKALSPPSCSLLPPAHSMLNTGISPSKSARQM